MRRPGDYRVFEISFGRATATVSAADAADAASITRRILAHGGRGLEGREPDSCTDVTERLTRMGGGNAWETVRSLERIIGMRVSGQLVRERDQRKPYHRYDARDLVALRTGRTPDDVPGEWHVRHIRP